MSKIWPIHLHPKNSELLTSWLVRLAFAYKQRPFTFTHTILPHLKVWTRDLDLIGNQELQAILIEKTCTKDSIVKRTVLTCFESVLTEKIAPNSANFWILPLGKNHRIIKNYAQMACPYCLREEPYFKTIWRLSCFSICTKHRCFLIDRCESCDSPINFHRLQINQPFDECSNCGIKLRAYERAPNNLELATQIQLHQILLFRWYHWSEEVNTYSMFYFNTLRRILVATHEIALKTNAKHLLGLTKTGKQTEKALFNSLAVLPRIKLLTFGCWLLRSWPDRFTRLSNKLKLWRSFWTKDSECLPYVFIKTLEENLSKKQRVISLDELKGGIDFAIRQNGKFPKMKAVERIFGNPGMLAKRNKKARSLYFNLKETYNSP